MPRKRQHKHRKKTKGKLHTGAVNVSTAAGAAVPSPAVLPTTPFSLFKCCIARARNLLTICSHLPPGSAGSFVDDTYRAAIVLAISALDAYMRTFVLENIVLEVGDPNHKMSEKLSPTYS